MNDKVIQRIDGVLKEIKEVLTRLDGITFEEFINTKYLMDGISFCLLQIGERMIKLEQLLGDKYPELPWKAARKMRNIIVHDYENANPYTIYDTAINDLESLEHHFLIIKSDIKHIIENSLETERLMLRPWDDMDAEELFELAKDPEIGRWCGWEPHKKIGDTLFVLHNFLEVDETYAICLKENRRVVGSITLMFDSELVNNKKECELGFWIGTKYQKNGYAFEASKRVIAHAFEDLRVNKIWCECFEDNIKSIGLIEKLNFIFDSSTNQECGRSIYSLTKENWLKKVKA